MLQAKGARPILIHLIVTARPPMTGDAYGQTRCCLQIMVRAIEQAGGSIAHVIRTRIMLTDIHRWHEAARADGNFSARLSLQRRSFRLPGSSTRNGWLRRRRLRCAGGLM
jgi:hypothetical protein